VVVTPGIVEEYRPGCSKSPFSKAASESKPEAYPRGYVEDFDETRTKLAGFFSILLVRLLGTVKTDVKLDRTMLGFAVVARAGNFCLPVCSIFVKSAERISALGDRRPGFVCSRDMGYEAACGERDVTALRSFSLRHAKTTRLFCRGV
jgi:hypothetical protein